MEKVVFLLTLLACGSGEQDLSGKILVFPEESKANYVKLVPKKEAPLRALTACFHYASDIQRGYCLFSLATEEQDNAFLIFKNKLGEYEVITNSKSIFFYGVPEQNDLQRWTHLCVTWESDSGLVQLWVNGKESIKKGGSRSIPISGKPFIVLGQEQDSYGGSFDKSQCLVGQMSNVHMWDRVLSPCEIQDVHLGTGFDPGNILSWKSMSFEITGYVILNGMTDKNKCHTSSLDPTKV
ncbi:serum amyloid P-component-like [Lepisosteus oculatus]|nr:PREDICTED: serum amyloid P-component-like [Lepisosteus oculatus]